MNILDAMREPRLFGPWFAADSWNPWRVLLAAIFGLPLREGGLDLFTECTGRETAPTRQVREGWFIVGRRGGKSIVMAFIAVFCAIYRTYKLKPGERGVVMLLASDRAQAGVLFRYIEAMLDDVPGLSRFVLARTKESISLTTGVSIEVHTNSYRAVRGRTIVVCIADEIAFWDGETTTDPDVEVLNAVRPAMITIPDALLLVVSSAYARRGELYRAYERFWGVDDPNVLVVKAPTWLTNPDLPREHPDIARAYEDDPVVADAEYGSNFRSDCERPLSREALQAVTMKDRREIAYAPGLQFNAFIDASGGSSDSMTLAIAHKKANRVVLAATREKTAPFDPGVVVADFAKILRAYRITRVRADRYAAEWPKAQFAKYGIAYLPSELSKSELYGEFIPMVNSQRVELLDDPRMAKQFETLERRTTRNGRDTIDHNRGGKDDIANAVAGAAYYAEKPVSVPFGTAYIPELL